MNQPEGDAAILLPIEDLSERAAPVSGGAGTWRIVASACMHCGKLYVPDRPLCLSCGGDSFTATTLPGTGSLYSFSTVHVSSSQPTPYTLGYVDLRDDVRILARIEAGEATLSCDQPMVCIGHLGSAPLFAPESRAAA